MPKIGLMQFRTQVGRVNENIDRADSLLPDPAVHLDLLVLPELALSGYNFKNLPEILPFLEKSKSGITAAWATAKALEYDCYVVVGYPEKVDVFPNPEYYNSAIVVNGDGEIVANYRKSHLYYTDETWAREGRGGFYKGLLPKLGNVSIGICMDLNPKRFEAPWDAFEFSFHVLEAQSNLVIMSMAWSTRADQGAFGAVPNEPDWDTLLYWIRRFEPLIRAKKGEKTILVLCNRCGCEDDATYAGTSAVIGIQDGEVTLYGILGRDEERLLIVDTDKEPLRRLVYRPDDSEENDVPLARTPFASTAEQQTDGTTDVGKQNKSQAETGNVTVSEGPAKTAERQLTTSSWKVDPSASDSTPSSTMRPKLTIPKSTSENVLPSSSLAGTSYGDSKRAVSLAEADKGKTLVHGIKMNAQSPEDSTPYPDSGTPLGGHPQSRRTYEENFSIDRTNDRLSPSTPSTAVEKTPRTLVSDDDWQPDTPTGEILEAFPWPPRRSPSDIHSKKGTESSARQHAGRQDAAQKSFGPAPSSMLSNRARRSRTGERDAFPTSERTISRPSAPKSYNASLPRTTNPLDQPLSQPEFVAALTKHLESVSRRADAVRTRSNTMTQSRRKIPGKHGTITAQVGQQTIDSLKGLRGAISQASHTRRLSSSASSIMTIRPPRPSLTDPLPTRNADRGRQTAQERSSHQREANGHRRTPSVDSIAAHAYYDPFRDPSSQARHNAGRRSSGTGPPGVDWRHHQRPGRVVYPFGLEPERAAPAGTRNATPTAPADPPPRASIPLMPSSEQHTYSDHVFEVRVTVRSRPRRPTDASFEDARCRTIRRVDGFAQYTQDRPRACRPRASIEYGRVGQKIRLKVCAKFMIHE